ncbi:hypothetical protein H0H81_012301 [Sphagnurus paluster]|uniref:Uncharacterized protein n=1 Tax=Sphagnurus paluster TaxID=117069 RepID=A0A9P7FWJ9_9AGAR|nr:hypothetical protein H0H81_012301 [Sphagnurus paluster]
MDTIDFASHPTAFLPPLIRLTSCSTQDVTGALNRLRTLYWPAKPPPLPATMTLPIPKRKRVHLIHDDSVPDSGYASAEDSDDEDSAAAECGITHVGPDPADADRLEVLRADTLQREFAVRWTTGFISRSDAWIEAADSVCRAQVLENATVLLGKFVANDADDEDAREEPAIMRSFRFPSPGRVPVTVELKDEPLRADDHTSVGLQSWGSSIHLGERISASPDYFSLAPYVHRNRPLRVLELGAGTGLLSILAAKLHAQSTPAPTIVATDYHPDVLANLRLNLQLPENTPAASVQVCRLDWERPELGVTPLDARFDVVLAADVIYHPDHARWLRACIGQVLERPEGEAQGGVCWIIVAVRPIGRHAGLDKSVAQVFGVDEEEGKVVLERGIRLVVLEMEDIVKAEGIGRADEVGYKLFKIGWEKVEWRY